MYKQTNNPDELLKAIQDFHHEFINENLMISHKMQGENFQRDLDNIFALFSQTFDFTNAKTVSCPPLLLLSLLLLSHRRVLKEIIVSHSSNHQTHSSVYLLLSARMGKESELHRLPIG